MLGEYSKNLGLLPLLYVFEEHPQNLAVSMLFRPQEMPHTANSPLDQFEIRDLISLNAPILGYLRIFLTNIGLYLTIAAVITLAFNFLASNNDKIVANH